MDERTLREKEAYDRKELKSELYSSVLKYTGAYYSDYRVSVIKDTLKHIKTKNVLELGSQSWRGLLWKNNLMPDKLTCINISEAELDNGIRLAAQSGVEIEFRIVDANNLEFENESFDIVFGGAILHHLDFAGAINEVYRVLKPGGEILFIEPLGINPVSKIIRTLTPFARTKDERPLGIREIRLVRNLFSTDLYFEQFLSVPLGVLSKLFFKKPRNIITKNAYNLDRFLDRNISVLRLLYRNVIIHGRKSKA